MSYITEADGQVRWDENSEFSTEEREQINAAGLTVPAVREWFAKFPHQNLETAITGLLTHNQHEAAKLNGELAEEPLKSEADDVVSDDLARDGIVGNEVPVDAPVEEVSPSEEVVEEVKTEEAV